MVGVTDTNTPIVWPSSYNICRFGTEAGAFFAVYNCLAMTIDRCMVQIACIGNFDADDNDNDRRTNRLLYSLRMCAGISFMQQLASCNN